MTSCGVWNTEKETKENFIIWSALVAVPMIIGPILTVIMEFILYLGKKCSKVLGNIYIAYLTWLRYIVEQATRDTRTHDLLGDNTLICLLHCTSTLSSSLANRVSDRTRIFGEIRIGQLIHSIISLERRLCNWFGLEVFLRESWYISGPLHHRHRRPCLEASVQN